jgi:hypothetical protein
MYVGLKFLVPVEERLALRFFVAVSSLASEQQQQEFFHKFGVRDML